MKFDEKQLDLENLDSIIARCEDAMAGKFKKKPDVAVVEVDSDAAGDDAGKPDLEGADLEDLLRMYEDMKGGRDD